MDIKTINGVGISDILKKYKSARIPCSEEDPLGVPM